MKLKLSISCDDALDRIARAINGVRHELINTNMLLEKLIEIKVPLEPAVKIIFFVEENGQLKQINEGEPMFQKVTESKKFAIKIVDKFGNDAKVDGAPVWAGSDASLVDIVAAEDGMSAVVTPKGPVGSLALQAKADADLGEGVKELLGELALDLIAGDAESMVISEVPVA